MLTLSRVLTCFHFPMHRIQLRYGHIWTPVVGRVYGGVHELLLYDDEGISQVRDFIHFTCNYELNSTIYSLMFKP